ncbi:sensor histidine kinase [Streptomyces roseolus]|uniref:sensor histidine kinase n=1 Tax=Streptomyces roseolus TaxID=67358 RepID=UPI00167253DC|nr:histidine kinase [Streptomyces roseolus]GGR58346.1 two-component sensor histidine kinase [Streptomyces roseolus]
MRLPPRTADALLAGLVLLLVTVWTLISGWHAHESAPRAAFGWALVLVGCGALALRRRWPVAVAVATLLACVAYYPHSAQDGPLLIAFALALYTTAAEGRFAAAVALAAVTLLAVGLGEARQAPGHRQIDGTALAMLAGWLISLVAVGRAQRTRTAYLHEVEQRALAAEREQEARARQSATEERLRIARELHDVLGHTVSLINVQSGAALHRLAKRPDPEAALVTATEALTAVRTTSKDALRELRATLGVLRGADEAAPTAPPASGLALLGDLLARARAAGLDVRTRVTGTPVPLPPPVDLAAYRIVQESLTNVTRHSATTGVTVSLAWEAATGTVRLRIADGGGTSGPTAAGTVTGSGDSGRGGSGGGGSGSGGSGGGGSWNGDTRSAGTGSRETGSAGTVNGGTGIRGMAERARALGGTLTAGPADGGGFVVEARLPTTLTPQEGTPA